MAYFESILTAPKVYLEYEPQRPEPITFLNTFVSSTPISTYRQVTTQRYEYRGMTRAAAESAAAALVSATVTAKAERENDAGAWKVSVVEQTIGAWS